MKIGVGAKPENWELVDYVLSRFSKEEQAEMDDAFDRAAQAAARLLVEDVGRVMNEFNTRKEAKPQQEA